MLADENSIRLKGAVIACALLLATAATAAPEALQTQSSPPARATDPGPECISISLIRRAEVRSDRSVLLILRNEGRIEMVLDDACPQLGFQESFTYRATAGQICAGRDRIVTRAGDACLIGQFDMSPPVSEDTGPGDGPPAGKD